MQSHYLEVHVSSFGTEYQRWYAHAHFGQTVVGLLGLWRPRFDRAKSAHELRDMIREQAQPIFERLKRTK